MASYWPSHSPGERLAAIATRGTHVAFSIRHIDFDGVSSLILMDRFSRNLFVPPAAFPIRTDERLGNFLSGVTGAEHFRAIKRLFSNRRRTYSQIGMRNARASASIQRLHLVKYFNPKTNKFVGLTDSLWSAGVLTVHVLNPGQHHHGCLAWVNLRPFLNDNSIGCIIAPFSVIASEFSRAVEERKEFTTRFQCEIEKVVLADMNKIND
jgi:hypothetical protein